MDGWSTLHYTSGDFAMPIADLIMKIWGLKVPPQIRRELTSCLLGCPEGGISNVHDCREFFLQKSMKWFKGSTPQNPHVVTINQLKARLKPVFFCSFHWFRQGTHEDFFSGEETCSDGNGYRKWDIVIVLKKGTCPDRPAWSWGIFWATPTMFP